MNKKLSCQDFVELVTDYISAQRFAAKTRTWLLIAGMTALLVGIGAGLGGTLLWVFVAIAVATNVIGYWFSDRLALRARRAQWVEPGTHSVLEATVQDIARRAQVPVPQLYLAERVAGV